MTFLLAMLHTGTVAAVISYFWSSWRRRFFAGPAEVRKAAWTVGLATGATLAVYLVLEQIVKRTLLHGRPGAAVEDLFSNLTLISVALACGGVLIVYAGLKASEDASVADPLDNRRAAWIGAWQGLVLPFRGLSRSGTTISGAMLMGVPRRLAEEFSFALAVVLTPPVIARELLRFYKARAATGADVHVAALATPGLVGMVCSFFAGLAALRWLSRWLENGRWQYFGLYCLVASVGVAWLGHSGL